MTQSGIYSDIENLVFRARLELAGLAIIEGDGVVE